MQIDADEIWQPEQITEIHRLLKEAPPAAAAQFRCRYFVGPSLVTVGNDCYGDQTYEWYRAWRWAPGVRFISHCPPKLSIQSEVIPKEVTGRGLTFDHYAYVTESQVRFKEEYYGYHDALRHWKNLQRLDLIGGLDDRKQRLIHFLPWVDDRVEVERL